MFYLTNQHNVILFYILYVICNVNNVNVVIETSYHANLLLYTQNILLDKCRRVIDQLKLIEDLRLLSIQHKI